MNSIVHRLVVIIMKKKSVVVLWRVGLIWWLEVMKLFIQSIKKKKEGDGLKGSPHNSRDSTDIPVLERNLLAFPCWPWVHHPNLQCFADSESIPIFRCNTYPHTRIQIREFTRLIPIWRGKFNRHSILEKEVAFSHLGLWNKPTNEVTGAVDNS